MGLVSITAYAPGDDITADGQNANEQAIVDEINGQLDDTNIKDGAAIKGSKIANAPNGIPSGKYNVGSIATADIGNLQVTKGKIAANDLTVGQLEITETLIQLNTIIPGPIPADGESSGAFLIGSYNDASELLLNASIIRTAGADVTVPQDLYFNFWIDTTDNRLKISVANRKEFFGSVTISNDWAVRITKLART